MSATLLLFRPFQTARDQAIRAGMSPAVAIAEVREAQRRGDPGNHIAGQYRALAWRREQAPSGGAA